jgi:hypothetical protein
MVLRADGNDTALDSALVIICTAPIFGYIHYL